MVSKQYGTLNSEQRFFLLLDAHRQKLAYPVFQGTRDVSKTQQQFHVEVHA